MKVKQYKSTETKGPTVFIKLRDGSDGQEVLIEMVGEDGAPIVNPIIAMLYISEGKLSIKRVNGVNQRFVNTSGGRIMIT